MRDIDRDDFYLKEFVAPIFPKAMLLAALNPALLWFADRLSDKQSDTMLAIAQFGGTVALLLLAWACQSVARRGWLHSTAAVAIVSGGVFSSILAVRAATTSDSLLMVLPAAMTVLLVGTIFVLRLVHLLVAFVVIMAPVVILTADIDPTGTRESPDVAHVLISTLCTIVPLYYLFDIIKGRYYRALIAEQHRATRDPLTSLLNRTAWFVRADAMLRQTRFDRARMALLYIDVDHFKRINDEIGHAKGDEVLQRLAALLQLELPPEALLSRYGGEEFVVMLEERERDDAVTCADRLRTTLAQHASADPVLTISVGIAFHVPNESLDDLLHRADLALLRAKALGRNRVEIADGSPGQAAELALVGASGP